MSKLKSIMDRPVSVTPHRSLNSCKGVIRCRELIDCDMQEILSELKSQAVSDITNITVRDSSGGRKNTNTFTVTFKQTTIPQNIKIGLMMQYKYLQTTENCISSSIKHQNGITIDLQMAALYVVRRLHIAMCCDDLKARDKNTKKTNAFVIHLLSSCIHQSPPNFARTYRSPIPFFHFANFLLPTHSFYAKGPKNFGENCPTAVSACNSLNSCIEWCVGFNVPLDT